jgi:hypothetical protein
VSSLHLVLSHTLTNPLVGAAAVTLETAWRPALAAALGLAVLLAAFWLLRIRRGRRWVRAHVRVVVGTTPGYWYGIAEAPREVSPPTLTVRIEPHRDPGRQVLEEVEP